MDYYKKLYTPFNPSYPIMRKLYKKFELMLTRCAKAYSSSGSVV